MILQLSETDPFNHEYILKEREVDAGKGPTGAPDMLMGRQVIKLTLNWEKIHENFNYLDFGAFGITDSECSSR